MKLQFKTPALDVASVQSPVAGTVAPGQSLVPAGLRRSGGMPVNLPQNHFPATPKAPPANPTGIAAPGEGLPKALNYYADYGGCGLWRMLWPDMMMNGYQKAVVNSMTVMVPLPHIYGAIDSVRIQRQASPEQYEFAKFLATQSKQYNFNLIYEIDDIVFPEDIPLYNKCRDGFVDPQLKEHIGEIIRLCDKFSVVSEYMKWYYVRKLDLDPSTVHVVPNYAPRFWLDNYYNEQVVMQRYDKHKKKPRIGYCGSGTHFDVAARTLYQDDFAHVAKMVISTMDKFQWVFLGGLPPMLKPYADQGKVETFGWQPIYDYPREMNKLELTAVVAPLVDNEFNRAKSDIKIIEAGALGIPGTFQDLPCYQTMDVLRFKTGEKMLTDLLTILKDENSYALHSKKARALAEARWLEDHLDEYTQLYFDRKK